MIDEAIVLAGGLGTRLRSAVADLPKSMAPVDGVPFLVYTLDLLIDAGVNRVILAVGYRSEAITEYFGDSYRSLSLVYAHEEEPLGTGGAIAQALTLAHSDDVWVLNGDTLFRADFHSLHAHHQRMNAELTIALKPMHHTDRYGMVRTNAQHRITGFDEKQPRTYATINAGVYLLKRTAMQQRIQATRFSFEKDFMEAFASEINAYGIIQDRYFLDIGIPADYEKAQREFPLFRTVQSWKLGRDWTLFLDRDGVINVRLVGDYVKSWDEFEFTPRAPEAIAALTRQFGRTVVVTNQQCIGKGIITAEQLGAVHRSMIAAIAEAGGKIDGVYFAPQLAEENHPMRKPGTGMGLAAKTDFPEIDFSKSVMIGDSQTDIEFGQKLGMKTVFIGSANTDNQADLQFASLADAAPFLC